MRFVIDLIIAFLIFYLITLTDPENFAFFFEMFQWVLPVLFAFYLIWDEIKIKEYTSKGTLEQRELERQILEPRLTKTLIAFIAILVQTAAFWVETFVFTQLFFENIELMYVVFLVDSLIIVLVYRFWKWDVPKKVKRTKGQVPS
jgi:magnesium-transporting ATPase (P-type)